MKALKYLLLTIVILFTSYSVWMAFLPKDYSVSRAIEINAPIDETFSYTADLKNLELWSNWFPSDTVTLEVSSPSTGSGAFVSFSDDQNNYGKFTFVKVNAPSSIDYEISFNGQLGSVGTLSFEENNTTTTKVTWLFEGEMPFLFRWVILSMDRNVGNDFETSLKKLKQQIETIPSDVVLE